jgi:hypothetical protein
VIFLWLFVVPIQVHHCHQITAPRHMVQSSQLRLVVSLFVTISIIELELINIDFNFIIDYCYYYYIGTRIIYDRNKLLSLRNSPLSRTPPANMANVPGVTRGTCSLSNNSLPVHPSSLSRSVSASDVVDLETMTDTRAQTLPTTREEEDDVGVHNFNSIAIDGSVKNNRSEDLFDMEME